MPELDLEENEEQKHMINYQQKNILLSVVSSTEELAKDKDVGCC